jgi:hypothetical protein
MTIDLTGTTPCVLSSCDSCHRLGKLYRLIGTAKALCTACFAKEHG